MKKYIYIPLRQFFPVHSNFLYELSKRFNLILSDRLQQFNFAEENVEYLEDIVGQIEINDFQMHYLAEEKKFADYVYQNAENILNRKIKTDDYSDLIKNSRQGLLASYFESSRLRRLSEKRHISLVILSAEYSHISRPTLLTAKELGIKTVNVEHGFHGPANLPGIYRPENPFKWEYLSDYMIINNNLEKYLLEEWMQVKNSEKYVDFGRFLNPDSRSGLTNSEAKKILGIEEDKKVIALFGTWMEPRSLSSLFQFQFDEDDFYNTAFESLKEFANSGKYRIVIKFHIAFRAFHFEESKRYIEMLALEKGIKKKPLILLENLEEVLACSDFTICSYTSSILWQSYMKGIPVAQNIPSVLKDIMYIDKLPEKNPMAASDLLKFVSTKSEIIDFINRYSDENERQLFLKRSEEFNRKWGISETTSEEVFENIGNWIKSLLDKEKSDQCKEDKLSILQVVHNFPPYSYAGTELYTKNISEELIKAGMKVTVLYPIKDETRNACTFKKSMFETLNVVEFNALSPSGTPLNDFFNAEFDEPFSEFLSENKFDVVHFQHLYGLSANWLKIAKEAGVKVVLKIDDFWFFCVQNHLYTGYGNYCTGIKSFDECADCFAVGKAIDKQQLSNIISIRTKILKEAFKYPDLIHTPSYFALSKHKDYGFENDNFKVIRTGIKPFINETPKKSANRKIRISYIGTIDVRKGIIDFIRAVEIYQAICKEKYIEDNLEFSIYGNGKNDEIFDYLINACERIAGLSYKGGFISSDRGRVFSETDYTCVPSLGENYPFIIRESLYAGVPVITTRVAGSPEIILDAENGYLFDSKDSNALAEIFLKINSGEYSLTSKIIDEKRKIKLISEEAEEIIKEYKLLLGGKEVEKVESDKKSAVIIVTYNSAKTIEACLESVIKHTEKDDEIIVIDNNSKDDTCSILNKLKSSCEKINLIMSKENLGFAKATNIGIRLSRSKYCVLLNPDTIVTHGWLERLEEVLNIPNAAAAGPLSNYVAGLQQAGLFCSEIEEIQDKPNLAAEKLISVNKAKTIITKFLIGFCLAIRRDVLDREGYLDETLFLGNEDIELSWRLRLKGYDLRIALDCYVYHEGQQSFITEKKSKTEELVRESTERLYSKLIRYYGKWNVPTPKELWGMDWFTPTNPNYNTSAKIEDVCLKELSKRNIEKILVSIIIPVFDKIEFTKKCIESLFKHIPGDISFEIIIIDNNSSDSTPEYLFNLAGENHNVRIISKKENLGFAKANNQGADLAKGKYLMLLNNDTEVQQGWLKPLIDTVEFDPTIGAAGSKMLYPDGSIQHAGVVLLEDNNAGDPLVARHIYRKMQSDLRDANIPFKYRALTAACLLVRKEAYISIGGLDEKYFNGYEDVDFCLRLFRNGWNLVYQPESVIIHYESQSGDERFKEKNNNIKLFHEKWLGKIRPDYIINSRVEVEAVSECPLGEHVPACLQQGKPGTKKISIVVLTFGERFYNQTFIESVFRIRDLNIELIIVDNGSSSETRQYLKKLENIRNVKVILNKTNLGFPAGINRGIIECTGDYILIANNDIILTDGSIERMLNIAESDVSVGIVGPMSNEVSGIQRDREAKYTNLDEMREYAKMLQQKNQGKVMAFPRVVFLCTLIKRELIEKLGGLDERFSPGNYEDDDYCLRAQLAGYKTLIATDAFVHHYGSKSFKADGEAKYYERLRINNEKFIRKWGASNEDIWLNGILPKDRILYFPNDQNEIMKNINRAQIAIQENEFPLAEEYLMKCLNAFEESGLSEYENLNVDKVIQLYEKIKLMN